MVKRFETAVRHFVWLKKICTKIFENIIKPYLYVACRGLRFLAVVLIAWSIRQKSRDALRTEPKSARFIWILLGLLCVSLALHVMDITPKLYFSISSTLGIYGERTVP